MMKLPGAVSVLIRHTLPAMLAVGALVGCSDREPIFFSAPVRLLDMAPLPSSAVTVTVESLGDLSPAWGYYYSGSDPQITFWNFVWYRDFLGTGSRHPLLVPNTWAGEWVRVTMDGGVRASAVRVEAYTGPNGFTMVCHTASGETVTSRINGQSGGWIKGVFDVQARDITYCRFPGYGAIESFSFVPQRAQPTLVLACNDVKAPSPVEVERGADMTCTATTEKPGATVSEQSWVFVDSAGHRIIGPSGADRWEGRMVVGGTVELTAKVAGQAHPPVTMAVKIRPRVWTGQITFPPEPEPDWVRGDPLVYPPLIEGDTLADGTLGKAYWPKPEPASGWGEGTGPNEGWFFLDAPPYFSPRQSRIYLNVALQPNDPFYRAQRGNQGQVVFGKPVCGQDFMRHAARHVPAHESGHYARAKSFAESREGAALLEAAVHFGDPVEPEQLDSAFAAYLQASDAIQDRWDTTNVLHVNCQFTPVQN